MRDSASERRSYLDNRIEFGLRLIAVKVSSAFS